MKHEMKMPDLATTGSAIRILRWLKQPGQPVKRGEFLVEIETDKAAMEVESTVSGTLVEIRTAENAEVTTGDVIAVFDVAGAAEIPVPAPPVPAPAAPPPSASAEVRAPAPSNRGGMFARNRAAVQPATTPTASGAEIVLSPARRTAARRLQESKQTVPHFYLQSSANATALIALREAAPEPKPTWDAFFVRAVARVLSQFEQLAYRFDDGRLVRQASTSIGVAADVDGELFVVSVDSPATQTVDQISQQIRQSVDGLRSGDGTLKRVAPGVFTISNLGATGIENFAAIINPPEAAILAIGAIKTVATCTDSGIVAQPRVAYTLSVDHRVVNGKYAASFLAALTREIESPSP